MPVDPVSLNSSLQLVSGSHRWGKWFIPRKFATQNDYISDFPIDLYESVPIKDIDSGKYHILQWAMQVRGFVSNPIQVYNYITASFIRIL